MSQHEAILVSSSESEVNIGTQQSILNPVNDEPKSNQSTYREKGLNHKQEEFVPSQPFKAAKYSNNYSNSKNLSFVAKQYVTQFDPTSIQHSTYQQSLIQSNDSKKSPKLQNRNQSCNPYKKLYNPVHEYVTIEFIRPQPNPVILPQTKYMSRERKPLAIVNPETKQVLNASHINSVRSQSISQSQSLDLRDANKQIKAQEQFNLNNAEPKFSPHIGRREKNKTTIQSVNTSTDSTTANTNKRSNTRDQRNIQVGIHVKKPSRVQSVSAIDTNNSSENLKTNYNNVQILAFSSSKDPKLKTDLSKNQIPSKLLSKSPVTDSFSSNNSSQNNRKMSEIKGNRKTYDKDFLMSLKDKKQSQIYPKELRDFEFSRTKSPTESNEISNPIKTYAAAAATAVNPAILASVPTANKSPLSIMKRSTTRERIAPEEPRRSARTQSVSTKQKSNDFDKKNQNYKAYESVSNKRAPSAQGRSQSTAKIAPRVENKQNYKPLNDYKPESQLINSKTYDVLPLAAANSNDPRDEALEEKLLQIFLREKKENYFEIFKKLQSEFLADCSNVKLQLKRFLRIFVTSLSRSCLDTSGKKFDINLFIKRYPILKEFIRNDQEFELETLKAVQALDHRLKHIPGVLFEIFYTEALISEDIFWKWKEDPVQDGHMLSVYMLKDFFEVLFELQINSTNLKSSKNTPFSTISSSKNIKSNLNHQTKSSSLKKNESLSPIVTSVGNSRKARIEKSKNKINSIINSTRTETTCTMCLQSYSNLKQQNIQLMSTICGHIICTICTNKLLFNNSIQCPTCKKTIDKQSVHDIFL